MGGFIGGALSGYADEKSKRKGKRGLLRGKKKTKNLPITPPNASNTTMLTPMAQPSSFRKGGRVKKTGFAKVHAGEKVIPAKRKRARSGKRR